jgi:hypothetical protein
LDDRFTPRPVAGWFVVGAAASLLFMLLGCAAVAMHLAADPAKLPLDERQLFEAEPMWVLAASGIGFAAGAIGALLLVARRKAAEPLLLLALLALFVWLGGMFATPAFRDLLSTGQIAVLLVVVALAWTIYWFARHSRQRRWLR